MEQEIRSSITKCAALNSKAFNALRTWGAKFASNLKFSQHCVDAANKAKRMLGFIKRNFLFKNKDVILPLYISLVRPHLEYAVQFWSPHQRTLLD